LPIVSARRRSVKSETVIFGRYFSGFNNSGGNCCSKQLLEQINRRVHIDDPHQRLFQTVDLFANGIIQAFRDAKYETEARTLEREALEDSY
jgi:hypothetical protein